MEGGHIPTVALCLHCALATPATGHMPTATLPDQNTLKDVKVRYCSLANRTDLEDGKLWQLEGQTYDQWVCGLADALLSHASNPLLRILQRCARKKPAMAELLLPHIFSDLAAHDADASLMVTISEQASQLTPRPITFVSILSHAVRLAPVTLQHLCGIY